LDQTGIFISQIRIMSRKQSQEPPSEPVIEAVEEVALPEIVAEVEPIPEAAIELPPEPPIDVAIGINPEPAPPAPPDIVPVSNICVECGYGPRHDADGIRFCPAVKANCPSIA
jgi:hypothetical protein